MAQLLKHYWIDRDNLDVYATTLGHWNRPMFGYVAPNVEGLEIVHRIPDANGIEFCLSTCPDGVEVVETEGEGMKVITQEVWDGIVSDYDTAQEAKRLPIVREIRDRLLVETDWIVIKANETGTNLSAEFKAWRSALRDIPNGDSFSTTLPVAPDGIAVSISDSEYQARLRAVPMINDPLPELEGPGLI